MVEIGGWDIAAALAKAVTYAATFGAAGAVLFLFYCRTLLRDRQRTLIRRLIGMLVGVAAAAGILRILLLAGSMSGQFAGMFDAAFTRMILGAGEGRATGLRMAGLALMLFAFSTKPVLSRSAILGAIAASTSFAGVGHIHGLVPNTAATLLLCLHLLCAAFWLGALPPLLIIAVDADVSQVAAAAARFGKLALRVVALLLAAGASLLVMLIGHAAQFWGSDYGRMMAIKLLAVAALLGAAAWNKLHLTPRLLKGDARAAEMFRRSVLVEMGVGALILLTTAALTTLTGPP
jgi:putative copper resistance protein D